MVESDTMKASRAIGILRYPNAQLAAVYGLVDLLEAASRLHATRSLDVRCWSLGDLSDPPGRLDALILPPSLTGEAPAGVAVPIATWIRARHDEGTTLCSVCVGAFLLAELGLLDGRPATTHWGLADAFAERFPKVALDADRLIVDDGDIVTAGGLMAWVDLGLMLVARFLGPTTALATARLFLVDPGGREQRFYSSFSPMLTHGDEDIARVQRWLQRRVGKPSPVDEMAKRARLGRRTFLRRFQRATGMKTSEYLHHLCVGRARELLELSAMSQQEIAWDVGYDDPGAFRRVFIKLMGLSPAEYRRRFGLAARA